MTAASSVLAELRKQIADNRKLLEEQEAALLVLEKMMGQTNGPLTHQITLNTTNAFDIDELGISGATDKQTLRGQVCNVITRLGNQEFTVAHIQAALMKLGITVNGKYPRSRISMILAQLTEQNIIKKTSPGGGKIAHKYRACDDSNQDLV